MNVKRPPLLLTMGLAIVLICLFLIWPGPRKQSGGLSVTFLGMTNNASGNRLAEFSVSNGCSRLVRFGVCEVQLNQTNGWPNSMRVIGGSAWLPVAAGAERVFSVPTPPMAGATWRVPLMYQEELSFVNNMRFRIDLLAWGIAHWRPGKPAPVRNGDRFHHTSFMYSPQMPGVENPVAQRTESSRSADPTNSLPGESGVRR